jgi:hypothetical protein
LCFGLTLLLLGLPLLLLLPFLLFLPLALLFGLTLLSFLLFLPLALLFGLAFALLLLLPLQFRLPLLLLQLLLLLLPCLSFNGAWTNRDQQQNKKKHATATSCLDQCWAHKLSCRSERHTFLLRHCK